MELVDEGEAYLRRAGALGRVGRFRLEAAIQAVHCDRARTGRTDWEALRTLYTALVGVTPSLGARVALAGVTGHVDGSAAGLGLPDRLHEAPGSRDVVDRFQPFHAARADLLVRAGPSAGEGRLHHGPLLGRVRLARARRR